MVSRRSASSLSRLLLDRLSLTSDSFASVTSSSSGAGSSSRLTAYQLALLGHHQLQRHCPSSFLKYTPFRENSARCIGYNHWVPFAQSAAPVAHGRHVSTVVNTNSAPDTTSENGISVNVRGDSETNAEGVKAGAWRADGEGEGIAAAGSEGEEPIGPGIVWIPPASGLRDVSGVSTSSPTVITAPPPSNAKRLPREWGVEERGVSRESRGGAGRNSGRVKR